MVTGNPDKKVRDYMKEVPQVKLVDKLSFTFGVMVIIATEFLALRYPQYFTMFYLVLITGLLVNRSLSLSETENISISFVLLQIPRLCCSERTSLHA